jgi:hypothetical protein
MFSGGFIFGLNCGGGQSFPPPEPDVISGAEPYVTPQELQRNTLSEAQTAEQPYSVKLFSLVGDSFLSVIPRGTGVDPALTKFFEDRSFNYFKAMNDFGYVVDAADRYINDANIPSSERNKLKGYKDAFNILFGGFSIVYPYFGESQEFAGIHLFNALKMLVTNAETFESPHWKMLYEYSRQDNVSRPGDERWMVDMLYADSMLQSMLNYAQSKLDEALTKIKNKEWTVKKQGGQIYLCRSSTWNNNAKINAEEYFNAVIWEGTQKDTRLAQARQVIEDARAECSACIPSEAFVAAIDPNIMENWIDAEVPEPDIPELVVYHLLQMGGGFAKKAAQALLIDECERVCVEEGCIRERPPNATEIAQGIRNPVCLESGCVEWGCR